MADDTDESGARPMPLPAADDEPRTLEPNMKAPSMKPSKEPGLDKVLALSAREGAAAMKISLPNINEDEVSTEQTTKKVSSPKIPEALPSADDADEEETRTNKLAPSVARQPSAPDIGVEVEVEVTEKMAVPFAAQAARPVLKASTLKMEAPRSSAHVPAAGTAPMPPIQQPPSMPSQPVFPVHTPPGMHADAPLTPVGVEALPPAKKGASKAWLALLLLVPAAGGVAYYERAALFPRPRPPAVDATTSASVDPPAAGSASAVTSASAVASASPVTSASAVAASASASAAPPPSASGRRRHHGR